MCKKWAAVGAYCSACCVAEQRGTAARWRGWRQPRPKGGRGQGLFGVRRPCHFPMKKTRSVRLSLNCSEGTYTVKRKVVPPNIHLCYITAVIQQYVKFKENKSISFNVYSHQFETTVSTKSNMSNMSNFT